MKIYLAGGMRNGWGDRVIASVPAHTFIDPRACTSKDEREYTAWDLEQVRNCDLLLAYMDTDNPSGFGLCVEVGYAAALGKPIWYVCEDALPRQKYFGMVRSCASEIFTSVDDAIAGLLTEGGMASQAPSLNQCDGCAQGAAMRDDLHVDASGLAFMVCQRGRYETSAGVASQAHMDGGVTDGSEKEADRG